MIVSAPSDYREAARRRLPRFLFDYIDGGAVAENTMNANAAELASVALRQRVLCGAGEPTLATTILDAPWAMPVALGPVGATGMYARRGEVQAARAASRAGIPYTLSTVSVCSIEEVASHASGALWSQLYVLKDRGYMRNALERAWAAGMKTLVFTVDMPIPGSRYRDNRSGMSGPHATLRQYLQACTHPRWAMNVGLAGRPLSFGNIEAYTGHKMTMDDYMGFISNNFDPSIAWHDLEWIRDSWQGKLIIKGILDADDARNAVRLGADGIVVSNHGGRQLDGAIPTARALPRVVGCGRRRSDSACRFRGALRRGRYTSAGPRRERRAARSGLYLCPGRGGRSGRGASAALICRGYEGYHDPHRRDLAIGHQPRLP